LQIDEMDVGLPGAGELRLRVHAFGLTRGDAMFRASRYLEHPILPGPDRPGGCRHG
jgi:NADPH:quinone reductase-like Zn-dependent oxidoreductase